MEKQCDYTVNVEDTCRTWEYQPRHLRRSLGPHCSCTCTCIGTANGEARNSAPCTVRLMAAKNEGLGCLDKELSNVLTSLNAA
jgi:hypothetical protein